MHYRVGEVGRWGGNKECELLAACESSDYNTHSHILTLANRILTIYRLRFLVRDIISVITLTHLL